MTKKDRTSTKTGFGRRLWGRKSRSGSSGDADFGVEQAMMSSETLEDGAENVVATQHAVIDDTPGLVLYVGNQRELIAGDARICRICLMVKERDDFPKVQPCGHRSCLGCLQEYFQMEISEGRTDIRCPECAEPIDPQGIYTVLKDDRAMIEKYDKFMLRRALIADKDARWCPAPDCGYAVIASGCRKCPILKCETPECGTLFCYHCRRKWHPNRKCYDMREELLLLKNSQSEFVTDKSCHKEAEYAVGEMKPCPRCNFLILKTFDGSCNEMVCSVCKTKFCWQCMQEISHYHFFGATGCSYYGRKTWDKKKRMLWQVGLLVGAPIAIGIAVTIALPTMIVGFPVLVGVKVFSRFKDKTSRRKRKLATAASVAASVVVSPIIAGIIVGCAMPGIIGYIYGVVPFSLCYTCVSTSPMKPLSLLLPYDGETNNIVTEL
ncbi:E3 ubiquitin-protein ligase RNF19A-like isoform X2 [Gigantopelta aegis]|uniref:E3 ubiquitin-protein ligase RNF19A-like isoform X2 n=1 Tax=Gigantopelta aegis TaxID=1735272 RepID=UPI001B88A752|nr:E3 ubiquitin-protein ligase RNF19A-like isoform X2 [Gigantopelta aegis]